MEIPYNVELRKDTGLYNAKLGIWLFLASEVMLFGGLFSAYILLRAGAPVWPPIGENGSILHLLKDTIPHATFNTLVLILSSVTMVMAWVSLKQKNLSKYKMYLGTTIICAIIFLIVKYFEYSHKIHEGFIPAHDTYMAIYFTMTGLHVLHIIGGLFVLGYLWGPGLKMWDLEPERFTNRIEVAGLYWHFVDLVWIFLFPVLYLLN
jgi:heme/copper-type cytochrome/quinol oxidase subunit 3